MDTFEYALIYGYEDEDIFSGEFDMSDIEAREQEKFKDDDDGNLTLKSSPSKSHLVSFNSN